MNNYSTKCMFLYPAIGVLFIKMFNSEGLICLRRGWKMMNLDFCLRRGC